MRVLVTRPAGEGAQEWALALAAAGAEPILYPTLAYAPPDSWDALDKALADFDAYDLVIFTSQTAVEVVVGHLPDQRLPAELRARIAVVGPATERAVTKAGGTVTWIPEDHRQEGLVELLCPLVSGRRVLLPIAAGGRTLLPERLRASGGLVDVVVAYQTIAKTGGGAPPPFDAVLFASPSALRSFLALAGRESLVGKLVAVIGSTTAKEAQRHDIAALTACSPDIDALIRMLLQTRNQGEC